MANLTLGLLGSLQVTLANAPVTTFESDKGRALLAYLAVESSRAHRREAIVGLLWPDCPERVARQNLRQTLYNIRIAVGDRQADPPYLHISREGIQFNVDSDFNLDVAEFESHLAATATHRHDRLEACEICAARLQQAVALYRGKFLEQFFLKDSAEFEEWALMQRESLHRRALEAFAHLANYHEQRGEYELALGSAIRQLEMDPWREEAHRQAMRVLELDGKRSQALAQYETCRQVLAEEFGIDPSAETRTLYEQIKRGETSSRSQTRVEAKKLGSIPTGDEQANRRVPQVEYELPPQLTPFVGRERELTKLAQLLADPQCRVLTLVGPGGIGKTRLALQTAQGQRAAFAQGTAFVPLASTTTHTMVAPAIAEALHFSFQGSTDLKQPLLAFLSKRQMLLILDNVEHLLGGESFGGGGVAFFAEILKRAPNVKLLVTSREQLEIEGEWVFQVEGLVVPDSDRVEGFEESSAAALFLQRVRRVRFGFDLSPAERAAVWRICRMVEGMPLALELAAAWIRVLSCEEIAEEIEQNLDFLTTFRRDVPERHRSLRAVFDRSWSMLSTEERRILNRLSVFRGGFSREAAEGVAGASLSALASLVAKSLVRRVEGSRYDMHELVRQYAYGQLSAQGEAQSAQNAHMDFFLGFAEKAEVQLHGPEQLVWLDRLDKEYDNLSAALEWSTATGDPQSVQDVGQNAATMGLKLATALYFFWRRRSHWWEGRAWLARLLAHPANLPGTIDRAQGLNVALLLALEQADTNQAFELAEENLSLAYGLDDKKCIARALNSRGVLLWKRKEYGAARSCCEQALASFRKLIDRTAIADALHYLAHIAINQGDYGPAQSFLDENVAICREVGDKIGLYDGLGDLGLLAYLREDYVPAQRYLEESLEGFRQAVSIPGAVAALNRLGDLARCRGDYDAAGRYYSETLALYRDMGDKDEIPSLLHNSAYVALNCGENARALDLFKEALAIQQETGNQAGIAECLAGIAGVFVKQDRAQAAARLFGAARAMQEARGVRVWPVNRLEYGRIADALELSLDESTLERLFQEGRSIAIGQYKFSLEELMAPEGGN